MKRIILTMALALVASAVCNAEIKAPVQTDTLVIKSMQYHFEDIRPENWPFKYVLRDASAFHFGKQDFKIKASYDYGIRKQFELIDGRETLDLNLIDRVKDVVVEFSGYRLVCEKPRGNQASEVYETISDGIDSACEAIKQAASEAIEAIRNININNIQL